MRNLAQTSSLSGSLALAVALALIAQSHLNADDALFINVDAIQVLQPVVPAEPKPAKPDAKPKAAATLSWLDRPIVYPTLLPNPLAFNVTWVSITNRKFAAARPLANRQKVVGVRRAAVVRRPAPVPNAAAQNAIQQQMRKLLEPMLKTELSFAARVTDLNPIERKKLAADGKAWFEKFLVDFLKNQDPNQQQMMLQGMQGVRFGNQQQKAENPREAIRVGVTTLMVDMVSRDKFTAYRDECKKRDEFARQVAVDNLMERIDEKVKLSPDQWKKITKSLGDHWDQGRDPQLEAFALNQSNWPGAPVQWVLPELSPAQQTVLKRVNTMSGRMFFNGGMFGQMFGGDGEVIDDMDNDAKVEAAEPAAPGVVAPFFDVAQPAAAPAAGPNDVVVPAADPAESSEAE